MIVVSLLIGNLRPPPALLIESIDGLTYSPSGALMSATPRFAETAKSYERYPAPPSVCEMPDATPSLPFAPVPTGHCTALSAPTFDAHSGLSAESHPVHTAVVPDSSDRWTTWIGSSGRFTPGFWPVISASFHLVTLPRKMSEIVLP